MSTSRDRLTIGLPVRNGEQYLEAALASLLAEDLDGLRVVVNDNASTDRTAEIVSDVAAADPRVTHRRHAVNIGANRNFNDVFDACSTELFKWAAVDDLCAPGLLARAVEALDARPDAVIAYGRPLLIDGDDRVLNVVVEGEPEGRAVAPDPVDRFADVVRNEIWCTPVFGVVRADALRRTARLRPFYGADKVLLAELALLGRFVRLDDTPFYRRCHDEQSTVLDAKAKAKWTTGRARQGAPAVVKATGAYLSLAARAEAPPAARARALGTVARTAVGPDKLRKLVRPGPYNYFGWRGRAARHAYEGLDLAPTGDLAPTAAGPRRGSGPTERSAPVQAERPSDTGGSHGG